MMSRATSKSSSSEFPEFAVRREAISEFFDPPLARSTFYDLRNKGKIVPLKDIEGMYLLNESLRRLGLREVKEIPKEPYARSLEDIVRLAFTLIDRELFPEPSWLLHAALIDLKDADHASKLAAQYREKVDSYDSAQLKLAYFQGVLDWVSLEEAERSNST